MKNQIVNGLLFSLSALILFLISQFLGIVFQANDIISWSTEVAITWGIIWALYNTLLWIVEKFTVK